MNRGITIARMLMAGVVLACSGTNGGSPRSASSAQALEGEGRLTVPAGFKVTYFARGLNNARAMTLGPDGAVYVSSSGSDEILRLVDGDDDGMAESRNVAVGGLNRPYGLVFHKGWLYIANNDGVVRVRLGSDGRAAGQLERVNRYSGGGGHWTRTILFGPDSGMYVSIGSSCNICVETQPDRAAVMRFDENGQNGRLFAIGLRNAVGMAVHPVTNEIWVSQHERDNIEPDHQDLPPEEINILRDGGDYGWPYCHSDRVPNPEFNNPSRCSGTILPALEMQAHSAPMGLAFLDRATMFPTEYRGDALLAFHGSWNRSVPTGAKVVRIRVKNGKPVSYEDFITGWQRPDGSRWGEPVDILVHKDGSVLVSDDRGNAIYQVTGGR